MTNYKQVRNNGKRGANIKEGNGGALNRRRDYNARLEAAGFTRIGWNRWSYTWQGEFPTFTLAPGTLTDDTGTRAGLIARRPQADIEILFAYGTDPADIKVRLDDEILEIMRLQADAADPLPADSSPTPFMGEPYRPAIVEGQEIGSEIDF